MSGSFITDRYDTLPPNVIFHHGERFQWHNDDPDHDTLPLLQRFRVPYLQEQGYVNLRCVWAPGCPVEIRPAQDAKSGPVKYFPKLTCTAKLSPSSFRIKICQQKRASRVAHSSV